MKIKHENPPNIQDILQAGLKPEKGTIFCYGDIIYNPSGQEIPEDTILHESVHTEQQKKFSSPSLWWTKYLYDIMFREDQELEAYTKQWLFIKKHIPKATKEALEEFATKLSSDIYKLNKSKHQIETLIRLKAKEYDKS